MSLIYNREYKLTIITKDGEVKSINSLRVIFEITKTIRSYPNLARIELYNINNDTLRMLETKYTQIQFEAGYKGSLRLLFKGQIRNVTDSRRDIDRIVTVYAGDGEQDWQNATFNKTLSSNIDLASVLRDIGSTFSDIFVGSTDDVSVPADKLRGQSLSGSSKDILDNLAEDYGFNWSIQDGEMVFSPKESPPVSDEAILLTASTGMIGSPTITEIGVNVTSMLIPNLQPYKLFKVQSVGSEVSLGDLYFRDITKTKAEGTYFIQEVTHKGDTHDNEWSSVVKGATYNV